MRRNITIILVITLLLIGVSENLLASRKLAQDTIEVRIRIPSVQKLEVVDTVVIDDVSDEFKNSEDGQAVIIENAGTVRVLSNSDWRLEFNNIALSNNYDVLVRLAGSSNWQNVTQGTGSVNGSNGSQLINYDLKIVPNTTDVSNISGAVQLGFTFGQF